MRDHLGPTKRPAKKKQHCAELFLSDVGALLLSPTRLDEVAQLVPRHVDDPLAAEVGELLCRTDGTTRISVSRANIFLWPLFPRRSIAHAHFVVPFDEGGADEGGACFEQIGTHLARREQRES